MIVLHLNLDLILMSLLLISLGFVLCLVGIIGSFLPVLPGPPISWLGLLLLYLAPDIPINYTILGITFGIAAIISVLDYIIPAYGTKRFGGSKYGMIGTSVGLVVGILSPIPLGFLIGAFLGAFLGELIFNKSHHQQALKAATGSFIGFIGSSFLKFVCCLAYTGFFVYKVIELRAVLF